MNWFKNNSIKNFGVRYLRLGLKRLIELISLYLEWIIKLIK